MTTKSKTAIALVIAFAVTLIIGVMLHLKSHGMLIQPRGVLKVVHWTAGYVMTVLLFIHWNGFGRVLAAMRRKFPWFFGDTWLVIILFIITLLTGSVKLLSPVKIPHLGLWHYGFGIAMSIVAGIHIALGVAASRHSAVKRTS